MSMGILKGVDINKIERIIDEWRNKFASPYSNIAFDFLTKALEQYVIKVRIEELESLTSYPFPEDFSGEEYILETEIDDRIAQLKNQQANKKQVLLLLLLNSNKDNQIK